MARPLRLEFPGAIYHVTGRGNARQDIFLDDADRDRFLDVLAATLARAGWVCHAWCLMGNHYHLLVETPEAGLSSGMRQLNGIYTQRFNRRHGRVGHLFQGRFKAIVVERDAHLLELARYIVLNPVRAGMANCASHYPWSSYRATAGEARCPQWLTTDWILAQFAKGRAAARRRYARFVSEGTGSGSPWPQLKGQMLLGSQGFVEKLKPMLDDRAGSAEVPRGQRLLHRPGIEQLFPPEVLADKRRRDAAIRTAYQQFGYSMAAVAREAALHYSTVSRILRGER